MIFSAILFQNLATLILHRSNQGDLHLPGHDTDQTQCAMEWPTTVWQH
jgi:hypothetical protein